MVGVDVLGLDYVIEVLIVSRRLLTDNSSLPQSTSAIYRMISSKIRSGRRMELFAAQMYQSAP